MLTFLLLWFAVSLPTKKAAGPPVHYYWFSDRQAQALRDVAAVYGNPVRHDTVVVNGKRVPYTQCTDKPTAFGPIKYTLVAQVAGQPCHKY